MGTTSKRYSAEVRERAVRMVAEHRDQYGSQWAAIQSIAGKIGCTSESLRRWVQQLERENRELKRANEILRTASAYFAQAELDRRRK
jgi:transposase